MNIVPFSTKMIETLKYFFHLFTETNTQCSSKFLLHGDKRERTSRYCQTHYESLLILLGPSVSKGTGNHPVVTVFIHTYWFATPAIDLMPQQLRLIPF